MNLENSLNLARSSDKQDTALPATTMAVGQGPARRVGVIVLSMHRSGSSAITRMLSLLGCSLPKTLMSADGDNPRGHWESDAVAEFNDEVLAQAGTNWQDWLPVNPRLSETLIWPQLIARGRDLLRGEYADAPLFVLKDPRICKLAGFWTEVLAAEGVDPAFVLPLRNPIEVARSLAARDGFDVSSVLLIWLRHVLAAEAASRGRPRMFTDYSALLNNWEALAVKASDQLGVVWPRVSVLSAEEISQFLTPDLRHQFSDTAEVIGNPSISPWISKTYEVLLGWAQNGESSADYPILDAIMRAFDEAGVAFARPLSNAASVERRAAKLEEERAALVADRDRIVQRLNEVEAGLTAAAQQRDALVQERDALAQERDTLAHECRSLVDERDKLAWRLGEVEADFDRVSAEREAELALAHGGIDDLKHRLAVTDSTLRQREEEIAQIGRELDASRREVTRLSSAAEQECQRLATALAAAEDRAEQAEAAGETRDRALVQHATEGAELARLLRQSEGETKALKAELAQAKSGLDNRSAEIASLTRLYRENEQKAGQHQQRAEWLRELHAAMRTTPRWWFIMPRSWRRQRESRWLQRNGLFDGAAYLSRYPDVSAAMMDPLHHYILYGMNENRRI